MQAQGDFIISNFFQVQQLVFAHSFHAHLQITRLIYFYFYKNVILVVVEVIFQFVSGYSRERFIYSIFISSYNLVLTTLQSLIAIILEHRKFREPVTPADPQQYIASLHMDSTSQLTFKKFWYWMASALIHGALIAIFCLYMFNEGSETVKVKRDDGLPEEEITISKDVGLKDQSTVAFNIIIHVVFIKLVMELDNYSAFAIALILLTIAFNYCMISIVSWEFPGGALDTALVGLGTRSVYNPIAAILLIYICGMVICIELVIQYCSWKYGKYRKKKEKEAFLKAKQEKSQAAAAEE